MCRVYRVSSVSALGFRVWGFWFRLYALGFRVQTLVHNASLRVGAG